MKRGAGAALGVVAIFCCAVAVSGQSLSGQWNTTIDITPSPVTLTLESQVVITYEVSGWSFRSDSLFEEVGWSRQTFSSSGMLGLFSLASQATFSPGTPFALFSQWSSTASLTEGDAIYVATLSLTPSAIQLLLDARATLGEVTTHAAMTFGDLIPGGPCAFDWQGVEVEVDFPFACAVAAASISFDCDGFDEATFRVNDIAVPTLPWLSLDALLTFSVDQKSLLLSPTVDFLADLCFHVYVGMGTGANLVLSDLTIDGIAVDCEIGGVEFRAQSYWGEGSKPDLLSGTPYWEAYRIDTSDTTCCGSLDFDVTVYFLDDATSLFDVSALKANVSVLLGTPFRFTCGFEFDLAPVPAEVTWTVGFLVTW